MKSSFLIGSLLTVSTLAHPQPFKRITCAVVKNADGTYWDCGTTPKLMNIAWGKSWEDACRDNIEYFKGTRKCEVIWSGAFAVLV